MRPFNTCINFGPGQHGHFLEYTVNKYIYGMDVTVNLNDAGAFDNLTKNVEYRRTRPSTARHFLYNNIDFPECDNIIHINHTLDPKYDFIILVNTHLRSGVGDKGDAFINERTEALLPSPKLNWLGKLVDSRFFDTMGNITNLPNVPCTTVEFSSFYSLETFLLEIRRLAKFIGCDFTVSDFLISDWHTFISRNQGIVVYNRANQLLQHILNGVDVTIEDNWMIHAYLLWRIQEVYNIYDGDLFEQDYFPDTTGEVTRIIKEYKHESY